VNKIIDTETIYIGNELSWLKRLKVKISHITRGQGPEQQSFYTDQEVYDNDGLQIGDRAIVYPWLNSLNKYSHIWSHARVFDLDNLRDMIKDQLTVENFIKTVDSENRITRNKNPNLSGHFIVLAKEGDVSLNCQIYVWIPSQTAYVLTENCEVFNEQECDILCENLRYATKIRDSIEDFLTTNPWVEMF
jgi:hypothetical protein